MDFGTGAVIGLLGIIATVDIAQFLVVLDHRKRLTRVSRELAGGVGTDGP